MSLHGYARKRDANEPDIVTALGRAGAHVARLSGPGLPDLLVGFRGETHLLEVKVPGWRAPKKLTAKRDRLQREWAAIWRGAPVRTVTTPQEALAVLLAPAPKQGRALPEIDL